MPLYLSGVRASLRLHQRLTHTPRRGLEPSCGDLESRQLLSGTYTGSVFQDYNANGARDTGGSIPNASGNGSVATARDRGLEGVSVSAYDPAGNLVGSAVTAADGSYSLDAAGSGPYRIHFDNLPDGFTAGPRGPDSETAIRFAPDGGASDVSLGAVRPEDFSVDNPFLATQVYSFGSRTGSFANSPAIIGFPFSAGTAYSDPSRSNDPGTYMNPGFSTLATHGQVGATWGLAYNPSTGMVYAAAFFKKHVDFGPGGAGAIYQIPVSYDEATGLFTATGAPTVLATLASASANAHDPSDFDADNWDTGWAAAGTTSLGGIDISADGSTLYAMNLADRSLYAIPLADPEGATAYPVPIPANATGPDGSDIRPFAVTVRDGLVYIGMVNSAQSTQDAADLHSYVYSFDPTTGQYAQVLEVQDMTYNRGRTSEHVTPENEPQRWRPWSPTFRTDTSNQFGVYTQPMLTGLAFDAAGNLILGFRDRAGDQFGWDMPSNPASPTTKYQGHTGGEILRATSNEGGTFTIEQGIYSAPPGPGNKAAFYVDQNWQTNHENIANGGLAQVPGFLDVAMTADDAANTYPPWSGGVRWLDNTTGRGDKAYTVYQDASRERGLFGKSNGLGDLIYMSPQAPVEVGHRLWLDSDRDGIQDPGEPPLAGVTVELRDADGNLLASVATDAQGNYTFSSDPRRADTPSAAYGLPLLPGTDYTLVVPPDQPPLDRLQRTAAGAGDDDAIDSDGQPNGPNGWSLPITTAGAPISENSYDFGFTETPQQQLLLGDLVWEDRNNNGIVDAGEPGIAGVPVQLLDSAGNVVATTTTDADGKYLFTGLAPGDYRVRLTPLSGYRSSTGTNSSASGPYESAPDPDNDVNDDDNGTAAGEFIESAPITLAVGAEPTNDGDDDPNSNLTVDFGLFRPASVGDRVFVDADGDGKQGPGEADVSGIAVRLYDSAGNVVATTTTDANGKYLFDNLIPGSYSVGFDPATLPPGHAFTVPGQPGTADPSDSDSDPNSGRTAPFALAPGQADMTRDAGLVPLSQLDGSVYVDLNNNGIRDPGEPPIPGTTMHLTGVDDLDNPVDLTAVTAPDGSYSFLGLRPGTYTVAQVQPPGYLDGRTDPGSAGGMAGENVIGQVVLGPGVAAQGYDFGELLSDACLGGRVYYDLNHNGRLDEGADFGMAGVVVTLTGIDDLGRAVNQVVTTDAEGNYRFQGLRPGAYALTESQPRFFRHYATTAGSLGGAASGTRISGIVVSAGQCGEGYDFGELQPHGPQGKLREAAIRVGNAMERLRLRRALDPGRFDANHPNAGPIIGRGGIPWGYGSFPRAPRFIHRVPTLGSRSVRLGSGTSPLRLMPITFRPVGPAIMTPRPASSL